MERQVAAAAEVRAQPVRPSAGRPDPSCPLDGARALVTGASGDIGRAVAVALSDLGARVCVVGRTITGLRDTAELMSGPALVVPADLSDTDGLHAVVAEVTGSFGGALDVLVHCAGAYETGPIDVAPIEQLDRMYQVNVRAPYRLTQLLLPLLKIRPGHVVFVNSTQSLVAAPAPASTRPPIMPALRSRTACGTRSTGTECGC